MDREAASIFREYGGKTEQLNHAHFNFDFAVPQLERTIDATLKKQVEF